jgi:uncharacterized membrane protein
VCTDSSGPLLTHHGNNHYPSGDKKRLETGPTRKPEAPEILKRRYARGEIEKEEFEAKRKDLT